MKNPNEFISCKKILQNVPDLIFITDEKCRITFINKSVEEHFNVKLKDIIDIDIHYFWCGKSQDIIKKYASKVLADKKSFQTEVSCDDRTYDVNISYSYLNGESTAILIARNITKYKLREKQKQVKQTKLMNTHRLASVGTLATGIAHEINNPLSVIEGYLTLQEEGFIDSVEDLSNSYKTQRVAIKKIVDIVKVLREYAQNKGKDHNLINVRKNIENTIFLINNMYLKNGIVLDFVCEATRTNINGNNSNFQQAIINLLNNSFEAIGKDGRIKIRLKNENKMLKVCISDNGCGIKPSDIQQIFDPFFTTKHNAKNSGLGLTFAKKIIQSSAGKMKVTSKVDVGTIVEITLPLAKIRV